MPFSLSEAREISQAAHRYGHAAIRMNAAQSHLEGTNDSVELGFRDHITAHLPEIRAAVQAGRRDEFERILSEFDPATTDTRTIQALVERRTSLIDGTMATREIENLILPHGADHGLINHILDAAERGVDIAQGIELRGNAMATELNAALQSPAFVLYRDTNGNNVTASQLIEQYNAANPTHALTVTENGISAVGLGTDDTHAAFAAILGEMKQDIAALRNVEFDANRDGQISLGELNTAVAQALEHQQQSSQGR